MRHFEQVSKNVSTFQNCLASLDRIFRTIIVVVLLIATNEEKGKPHLMART